MKPVYLEFCGLNSFSEKAEIDFSALLSGGVFGIFGDTGSGKSTILDAIHFALYGVVDRVPQAFNDCINFRSEGVSVTFDFQIVYQGQRKTFRVKRERKRKTGSAKAYLYEKIDADKWFAIAEGVSEVDKQVEEIVGLSFNDFKTCIALPQGDFDALVHSKLSERVKLMARLFNLEKYGERLSVAVNTKHAEALRDLELLQAQMGENEGADEEKLQRAMQEVDESERLVKALQQTLEERTANYTQTLTLWQEKQAFMRIKSRLLALENRLQSMKQKRELLQKSPSANAVMQAYRLWTDAKTRLQEGEKTLERARLACQTATRERERAWAQMQESNLEDALVQANVTLSKIRAGAQDIAHEEECYTQWRACQQAYKNCKYDGLEEDFENSRLTIENKLSALGEDEDLLSFLKRNLKEVMLSETYAEFQTDLRALQDKYPQTEPFVKGLLEKYRLDGQRQISAEDIENAQRIFKQREEERKRLKAQLEGLEKRRQAYEKWKLEREAIATKGKLLHDAYELAHAKTESVRALGTATDCEQRLALIKSKQRALETALEKATQAETETIAKVKQWESLLLQYQKETEETEKAYLESLRVNGYTSVAEAQSVMSAVGETEKAKAETDAFFEEYALYKAKAEETDENKFASVSEESVETLRLQKAEAEESVRLETVRLGARQAEYKRLTLAREKYAEQEKELVQKQHREKLCEELRLLVRSNKFLEFIASEYLQEICASASRTLVSLTGGKYFLKYDDKEFKVGDNLNGGALRVVKTLSGGETFLVSLSLALSLSGAICAQSQRPIEFFFLDEGFGTLDEKLVDTVMDVLGKLSKSFSVGLISHVEELKRRIEYKAVVTGATETHGSTVKIETF